MSQCSLEVCVSHAAPLLQEARIDAQAGEVVALVGPSGSGKSSLLRAIAGLLRVDAGYVRCGDLVLQDSERHIFLPPERRPVGFMFQNYALFPHLSAEQNVMLALGHLPADQRRASARALLQRVNLESLEDQYPATLSGGQQQRVALARALARQPRVLLLDEPFSAVDQVTRRKLHTELARLRQHLNLPVLLVTHDLHEARQLADRIFLLHRGRMLQSGPVAEVFSRPASPLVARLMDQQNIFDGRIVAQDPAHGTWVQWGKLRLLVPYRPDFSVEQPVSFVLSPAHIILHRADRPSQGDRENPVDGILDEALPLGEQTALSIRLADAGPGCLHLMVHTHVASRLRLAPGSPVRVSVLRTGIHLMLPDQSVPALP